jgi:hypothetical protein
MASFSMLLVLRSRKRMRLDLAPAPYGGHPLHQLHEVLDFVARFANMAGIEHLLPNGQSASNSPGNDMVRFRMCLAARSRSGDRRQTGLE